jgi:hypothetical protein
MPADRDGLVFDVQARSGLSAGISGESHSLLALTVLVPWVVKQRKGHVGRSVELTRLSCQTSCDCQRRRWTNLSGKLQLTASNINTWADGAERSTQAPVKPPDLAHHRKYLLCNTSLSHNHATGRYPSPPICLLHKLLTEPVVA